MRILFVESKKGIHFVKVDYEDYPRVSKYKWHVYGRKSRNIFYVGRHIKNKKGKRTTEKMHRCILGLKDPKIQIDHSDHDGLNNQKSNLRICSNSQNQANRKKKQKNNTSGHTGVYWHKRDKKWRAYIKKDNKIIQLGYFDLKILAIAAYRKASIELFGEYSPYYAEYSFWLKHSQNNMITAPEFLEIVERSLSPEREKM